MGTKDLPPSGRFRPFFNLNALGVLGGGGEVIHSP